jgi:RNA polymerase sporulation-specific sigma factor
VKSFPKPLSPKEEYDCLKKVKQGDMQAREILIERNLRLVAHIVKKYQAGDRDMEDLISIGTIGLIKAIDTFHMEKGTRLATYASRCIDNELLMVFRADKKQSKEVYLNEPVGADKEGNEITLLDVLEADAEDVVERLSFCEDVKNLYKNIEKLPELEKTILRLRYGLSGNTQKTQREIAEEMGISRSYVSRIEKRAVEKVRKMFGENFTK